MVTCTLPRLGLVLRCALGTAVALAVLSMPAARAGTDAADSTRVRGCQTGAVAPDRLQHASLSFALGLGAGIGAREPAPALVAPLALGLTKEWLDRRRGGRFDALDFAAGLAGAALAAVAVSALER
jgi:hypothetical protein